MYVFFRLFDFFPNTPYINFSCFFPCYHWPDTIPITSLYKMNERVKFPFFLFEIFFNIFWQCLLEFFKKNEQIRTGCCLQCMLGQDTNHHPSATSNVWLALTAKGQRDSHVSSFCLTKTSHNRPFNLHPEKWFESITIST